MIYCPKCSETQGGPVQLGDTKYTQGNGAELMSHAVYHDGKLIRVTGKCPVCESIVHVEQEAKLNEDGSYTILSVAQ